MSDIDQDAKLLWEYNKLDHKLQKADAIVALGSHDIRVAERAGELFLEGWAPVLVVSGYRGRLTGDWEKSEAEVFADAIEKIGVDRKDIILEMKSTNTGENMACTRELLREKGIEVKKVILVSKPYMERRAYATCQKRWPEVEAIATSPMLTYETYPDEIIPKEEMIHILVGDTQRNNIYGDRGYQVPQIVPPHVWEAYERLVRAGYTKYLVA